MVRPGLHEHHKGGFYSVLFVATESTNARNGVRVVVYVSLKTGEIHTRDESEFEEQVHWPGTLPDARPHARFVRMDPK